MAIGFLFLSETHLKYWVFTIPISLNQFPGAYYKEIDLILRCKMSNNNVFIYFFVVLLMDYLGTGIPGN